MNDQAIEQEIQAKCLTAPRVTPADIEANIASEHYFTATEGVFGAASAFDRTEGNSGPAALDLLTFCVLVLRNGFTVTGESACASPENFDADVGRKIARQNAVNKVWPLMGYELKCRLHAARQPVPPVVLASTVDEVKETLNNTPEGYGARFVATQAGRFTDVSVPANWPDAKQEGGAA